MLSVLLLELLELEVRRPAGPDWTRRQVGLGKVRIVVEAQVHPYLIGKAVFT